MGEQSQSDRNAEEMPATQTPSAGDVIMRHRLSTRIWHWVNAGTILIMLMSGLMIFNAHPRLYWGKYGANHDKAWLVIDDAGDRGYVEFGGYRVTTTGVLGIWKNEEGVTKRRAFPYWATIPSGYDLEIGRRWHFFFAWIFGLGIAFFMLRGLTNGHIRRDLLPKKAELAPRHIWHDIKEHARLRFPTGAAAINYNILQKLAYNGVIFVLIPLMILTGLTMSPAMNAAWPWLLDIFGGRQSARSIHFISAFLLVLFFLVHMVMVVLAGPVNEIRSMITGKYRLPGKTGSDVEGESA